MLKDTKELPTTTLSSRKRGIRWETVQIQNINRTTKQQNNETTRQQNNNIKP